MARKMVPYMVLFTPQHSDGTVSELKIIDAWSSSGGIEVARSLADARRDEYRQKHGFGWIEVIAHSGRDMML